MLLVDPVKAFYHNERFRNTKVHNIFMICMTQKIFGNQKILKRTRKVIKEYKHNFHL